MKLDDAAHGYMLSIAAAKHVANAMCYDDMIRVADLKTRSTRGARVRREVGLKDDAILQVTEYFHPRIEEFCGTMPAGIGRFIEARPKLAGFLDRRINHGRRIRTDSFAGFAALWMIGGMRRWRRRLLRHAVEAEHLERWYQLALGYVSSRLFPGRRNPRLSQAHQGLQRHPRPRPIEIRPGAVGTGTGQGARRRRPVDPPAARGGAEGREGRHARRRAENHRVAGLADTRPPLARPPGALAGVHFGPRQPICCIWSFERETGARGPFRSGPGRCRGCHPLACSGGGQQGQACPDHRDRRGDRPRDRQICRTKPWQSQPNDVPKS